ncbi:site-specific integrase [Alloacidobacterium dinghuense]|uniref:Site-specific integrase n=1 Tax=Alloacidobacterium dinghuense TaxID=2763107 RepID=A0A7G8BHR5_9BACT|nr:site-specific integrase [Alloacidobacterium dinghuense]QNI32085.1 site-specific integrase [Alloacidobacterium dinghuense]
MGTFKRGRIYWYEFRFRGVRIRESSYSPIRAVAERKEREHRRNLELGNAGLKRIESPLKVAQAITVLLEEKIPHWEPSTLENNGRSWKHLSPHFGKLLLDEVSARDISRYQLTRKKEGAGNRTINMEIELLRQVMIKHRRWQLISPDVRMLKEREDIGKALRPDEQVRLLDAAKKSVSQSLYPAILLSIHSGMRINELRHLRWHQVDLAKNEIVVGRSKTLAGEGRVIPLSATALICIKEWKARFPEAKLYHFVFPSERYRLYRDKDTLALTAEVYSHDPAKPMGAWKRSWISCQKRAQVSCRWHDLRHTFVSRMGENGVPDQTLMAITGHLSRKMLERYSHARMESKRAAVRTLDSTLEAEAVQQNESSMLIRPRYNREELYEKVWTMPVRIVAREYGVSDAAIAKACRRLQVPVPGRGYWAKRAANRSVKPRPPLLPKT